MEYRKALQVLGLTENFTEEELKSQYKILAKKYHPDNEASGDNDKFIEINEAYQVLINKKPGSESGPVDNSAKEPCPRCNGTGKRRTKIKTAHGFVAVQVDCDYCNGTGIRK